MQPRVSGREPAQTLRGLMKSITAWHSMGTMTPPGLFLALPKRRLMKAENTLAMRVPTEHRSARGS